MVRLYHPLFSYGSLASLLCYLTRSMGYPLYLKPDPAQPDAGPPKEIPRLSADDINALQRTTQLTIHSSITNKNVGPMAVQKLPSYLEGTSTRSVVFYTTWPLNGGPAVSETNTIRSIAKGMAGIVPLQEEVYALRKVGDLVDVGWATSPNVATVKIWWVMIKDWTAAPYNLATIYMILAHQKQKQALTQQACYQHFRKAFLAIEAEMKRLVETHGLLHQDMNMCNVLFSNDLTKVVFIDWGLYSNHTVWDDTAKRVLSVASVRFKDEEESLCGRDYPKQFNAIINLKAGYEAARRGGPRY